MRKYIAVALVLSCAVVVLLSGCRRKNVANNGLPYSDTLQPGSTIIEGDIPLAPFGEMDLTDGRRVRDVNFDPALFAYDSAQINASEGQKVARVADYMRRNPQMTLVVEGHCDERGSREYNLALGEKRALAARAYLVGLGVRAESIHTRSLGEEQPADPGHDESAWQRNRRAEFLVYQ